MSVEEPPTDSRGAGGPGRQADGSPSRQCKNNRQGPAQVGEPSKIAIDPSDMPDGTPFRPLSVDPEVTLRDEARMVKQEDGVSIPLTTGAEIEISEEDEIQARPWHRVVSAHADWHRDYLGSHIEFENEDGKVVRTELENSYMPEYGDRYYAKLMDLRDGVRRRWDGLTTVMLTLSASTINAKGTPRCPADHMREIAEGWRTARKQLYQILEGRTWTYARVWEPTSGGERGPGGYGHMHVAVFVEDGDDLDGEDFDPFMRSYVEECAPAGWDAHKPSGDSVSVVQELEEANMATYVSEYIGSYGEEMLERPINERAFYAVTWATRTRRVEFGNDAQDIIAGEKFRRETGLRPEDRGEAGERQAEASEGGAEVGETGGSEWSVRALCTVERRKPDYYDPSNGVIESGGIDGRPGVDPPKDMGGPPPV